jgi:putative oxidoreductase
MSGFSKITAYAGTQQYMEAMGVPGILLPLVILAEVGLGIAVIVGFQARWAALGLAGFSMLAAILFHADFSNQAEMINFMKNFAMAGAFLLIFSQGPGSYSLDNRTAAKNEEST